MCERIEITVFRMQPINYQDKLSFIDIFTDAKSKHKGCLEFIFQFLIITAIHFGLLKFETS